MKFITLFLSLFNIKKMKSSTTMQIIQSHAIMNFLMADWNFPKNHILEQVFKDDQDHLKMILNLTKLSNDKSFLKVFQHTLDNSDREKVIRWIMENYKGIDVANVAAYYIENEEEKLKRLDSLTKDGLNHG